jgi:UDP-N-acetylglucosamine diphosphorylase / glucose-1-phosphate thymidylyltransferase / UDP-N-acetylgalactosamine diphosphorylase / glucosamine-1-phosphate N-acetyltransferase / galactosamine-1-phosphate N-acetyltransferase
MNIIIFEDDLHDGFYPLSLTRPLWELKSGLFSFRERLELFLGRVKGLSGSRVFFFTREYLAPYYRERYPRDSINDYSVFESGGDILCVNALKYISESDFNLEKNRAVILGPVPVLARVSGEASKPSGSIANWIMKLGLKPVDYYADYETPVTGRKANFIWELVDWNRGAIRHDFALAGLGGAGRKRNDVTIIGDPGQVYCEEGVTFEPHVVINSETGPVFIGSGTKVQAFTRIEGPCAIGRDCLLAGVKISGSTLGPVTRVGGEVEQTIIQGYSNKYHEGFIGHSYIGEWVNLGALTTNSDLKNDYTNVKVYTPDSRKKTGLKKVGCFMGDYVKTSIGTLINTGSSIGPCSMLVHMGGLTPFHIPPFSWYINGAVYKTIQLEDFLATAREVLSRRGFPVTETFVSFISGLYAMRQPAGDKP